MSQISIFDFLACGSINDKIQLILNNSTPGPMYRGRQTRLLGNVLFYFWVDKDGNYIDGLLQYKDISDNIWSFASAEEFINRFINTEKQLNVLIFKKKLGEKKLVKPKDLENVKAAFSVEYISNKAKCQVYIEEDNLWIRHVDYFSPSLLLPQEHLGLPLTKLTKIYLDKEKHSRFIYSDSFGDIVLKNEAWICLQNLIFQLKLGKSPIELKGQVLRLLEKKEGFERYSLESSYMERFFERIFAELYERDII